MFRKLKWKLEEYMEEKSPWKLIWGVSSCRDGGSVYGEEGFYQATDLSITYNKSSKKYHLDIETAFLFEKPSEACPYLKSLLNKFTDYMMESNRDVKLEYVFFFSDLKIKHEAETVEELYRDFKIFVKGYCAVYEGG